MFFDAVGKKRKIVDANTTLQDLVTSLRQVQRSKGRLVERSAEYMEVGLVSEPPLVQAFEFLPDTASVGCSTHLVKDPFRYYHYGLQGLQDQGWGCGYRTVQTILSWLDPTPPPSIPVLQKILAKSQHDSFVEGGSAWIGVPDAVILLDQLHKAQLRIHHIRSGTEAGKLVPTLATHFDVGGGPVMVGGSSDIFSKTVVGVRRWDSDSRAELLVFDPHYSGETQPSAGKYDTGWVGWKAVASLCKDSFYNFGLPSRPESNDVSASQLEEDCQQEDIDWTALMQVVESGISN